jgi:hypothetical protein
MAERTRRGTVNLSSALSEVLGADQPEPAQAAPAPPLVPAPPVPQGAGLEVAALALPAPRETHNDSPSLFDAERRDLAACEAAIDGLRIAFWGAGKALQVIRDGRLYRETHATFEDYAEQRWQMRRAYADKLIRAWPLAERLHAAAPGLNEAQVRELLPLAALHGDDAAESVYETVAQAAAEVDGVRVTAAVIKGAVSVLPGGQFDIGEAARQVRAYVARLAAGEEPDPEDSGLPPEEREAAVAGKTRNAVGTAFRKSVKDLLAVPGKTPGEARKEVIAVMRDYMDELEKEG